ncbi:hypothetical protein M0804_007869 [Polistes exclamans]|nr:hypothetical protein M0804_007869 [Polistes exclamans]
MASTPAVLKIPVWLKQRHSNSSLLHQPEQERTAFAGIIIDYVARDPQPTKPPFTSTILYFLKPLTFVTWQIPWCVVASLKREKKKEWRGEEWSEEDRIVWSIFLWGEILGVDANAVDDIIAKRSFRWAELVEDDDEVEEKKKKEEEEEVEVEEKEEW